MARIAFLGDVCPGGVLPYQTQYVDKSVLDYLQQFDLRICTLEGAIGTGFNYEPSKLSQNGGNNNINYIRDEDVFRLSELDINIVSMANNHAIDLGKDGFINTIQQLQKYNIQYVGAGLNFEEASKPLIVTIEKTSIAIIACCIEGTLPWVCTIATENSAGIYKTSIETLVAKVKKLKELGHLVFVMPHWGEEHRFIPPLECKNFALMLASAGADAIFASHSHTYGPIVKIKNCIVAYALGNFLFPDFCMIPPRPMFYPTSKIDLKDFKRVKNYPKSIQSKTISIWDQRSRIGLVFEYSINNKDINYKFVKLSNNNILQLLKYVDPLRNFVLRNIEMPIGSMFMKNKHIMRIIRKIISIYLSLQNKWQRI